jgi:ABC-2 type transport system permease protein
MNNNIFSYWITFKTIVDKEVGRIFRIWTQTLLPPIITQSLYFVIFGGFIGSKVTESFGGVSYMEFIIPGLVMMSVITNAYQNVSGSFYMAKFQKNIEEILVSPTPNWVILLGYVMGGVVRAFLVGLIVLLLSLFFVSQIKIYSLIVILLFSILTASLFSLAGFLNALFAKSFDEISIVPTFVLTPLTYLGGVFFSIEQLPVLWQNIAKFNPVIYMIDGFRYGFYGNNQFPLWIDLGVIFGFNALFLSLCVYLLNKGYGLRN